MIPRKRRGLKPPQAVAQLVPTVLKDLGLETSARVLRIEAHWEAAVGPEIALHCRPTALRGETLEATVDSSVWCQQLQLRRPEMLEALQRILPKDAPDELWLRIGTPS